MKHSLQAGIGGSFVAEFTPDGQNLLFSTLLGGNTFVPDTLAGLQVGPDGTIFVAGSQIAEDFPYTVSAYRHPTYSIGYAQARAYIFASAINPQHTGYSWSTFLGQGYVNTTALDAKGNFYLGGTFSAGSMPLQNAVTANVGSGSYLIELDGTGALQFATGLGGLKQAEIPSGIAVDSIGAVYVAGSLGGAGNSISPVQDALNVGSGPPFAPELALGLDPSTLGSLAFFAAKIAPDTRPQVSLSLSGPVLALHNAGSADLHIASIVPSSGISSLISSCGSVLPAGKQCYLTPLSSTPNGNTLTINSDATPAAQTFSPQNLSAQPGSQLVLDGSQLNFPPQANGTNAPGKPLVITNVGSAPATVTSILTFGVFQQTSNCGTPIQPGASCTAVITAAPASGSSNSGSNDIGIVLGNGLRDDLYANFTQNSADGPLLLSTDTYGLAFGNVLLGTTSLLHTTTVTNSGQAPVTVDDPTFSTGNPGDFTLTANTCAGTMLQPQGSCVFGFTMAPSATGHRYTVVQVTGGGSSLQTGLSGEGVAPPSLTVNPTALNFGPLAVGSTTTLPLQLTNTGTTAITLTDLRVSPVSATTQTDFSQTSTCPASLAAAASCTITVAFTPSTAGIRSGSISLLLNGGIVEQDVALSGSGAANVTPDLTFAIPNQTFGAAPFTVRATSNSTAALTYMVISGPATITGSTLTLTGAGAVVVRAAQPAVQNFQAATATATFTVAQATPQLSWAIPASISHGTALGAAQLNATAFVAGTFSYTPAAGTIPGTGSQTLSVTFTPADTTDYTQATAMVTLVVGKSTPQITWAPPAAITYGAALSGQQLDASATVPGNFTYTPAAGAVLPVGTTTLSATFSPTDAANNNPATATVALTVTPASLIVSANDAGRPYGAANPALSAVLRGVVNDDTLSASADTAATSQSNVGTYAITPHVTGPNLGNYTVTPVNGAFTIEPAGSTTSLTTASPTSPVGAGVTFIATVASLTSGTPTGAVQFLLNGYTLATVPLVSGTATFSTSSLALGINKVGATYNGDGNFVGSGSTRVTETVVLPDFSLAATPATLTIARGQSGTATFTITPLNGFAQAVNLGCGTLPAGVTCSFAAATVTPAGGPVTSTLTVTAAPQTVADMRSPEGPGTSRKPNYTLLRWSFITCLFPLLALRRRKALTGLLGLVWLCGLTALSGCGASAPNLTGGAPLGAISLTVTASSIAGGSGTQHATNLTITITQ